MAGKFSFLIKSKHSIPMEDRINKILSNPYDPAILDFIYQQLPDNQKFDNFRFYYSLMVIKTILTSYYCDLKKIKVLELGGKSFFTDLLKKYVSNIEVHHISGGDYRKTINTSIKYDFVICMEIIEHLGDLDSDDLGLVCTYTHSGLDGFLEGIKKTFHSETRMLISTPNVNTYTSFFNLIQCRNPYVFDKHVHEYGVYELKEILERHFQLEYYNTIDLMYRLGYGFDTNFINDIDMLIKKYYPNSAKKNVGNERGTNNLAILRLK